MFPNNPTYRVIHATACALEGKQAAAGRLLEEARPGLSAGQFVAAKAVVELYHAMSLVDLADQLDPGAPLGRQVAPLLTMVRMGFRLRNLSSDQDVRFFPLPPLVLSVQARVLWLSPRVNLRIVAGGDPSREVEELSGLARTMPDGYFHLLRGMLLFSGDRFADAVDAFRSAEASPSIFKVREPALFLKAASEMALRVRSAGPSREAASSAAVKTIREVEALYDDFPAAQADLVIPFLIEVGELDLARRVLEKWQRRAPADPRLLGKRAAVELESGSFGRAIALSRTILARDPSDAEARRILASAEDQLARLGHAAAPKPPG